jgi:diacylglycerol kinase family enzyme
LTSALLIANPAASQFTGGLHRMAMRTLGREFDVRAIWPQSAEHSRLAARDAARTGVGLVIAMGGDGIVHHVAQGLAGTDAVLGIIPSGTTNVLARIHGIPHRAKDATRLLVDGHATVMSPTVEVSATGPDGPWGARAVFAFGVGVDATVVAAAESEPFRKYRFGGVHYARTTLGVVWKDVRKRKPDVWVTTSDRRLGIGALVQFHPLYTYFGRLPLRVDRDDPDPMSVLTIERLPIRRAPSILRHALAGTLQEVKGMSLDRGVASLSVDADPAVEVQMDGEHYGLVTHLVATARPASLAIAVPQSDSPR